MHTWKAGFRDKFFASAFARRVQSVLVGVAWSRHRTARAARAALRRVPRTLFDVKRTTQSGEHSALVHDMSHQARGRHADCAHLKLGCRSERRAAAKKKIRSVHLPYQRSLIAHGSAPCARKWSDDHAERVRGDVCMMCACTCDGPILVGAKELMRVVGPDIIYERACTRLCDEYAAFSCEFLPRWSPRCSEGVLWAPEVAVF